jgi:hypothetical protein
MGRTWFFCHPTLMVNPRDGGSMGVADMRLLARKREKDEQGKYKKRIPMPDGRSG